MSEPQEKFVSRGYARGAPLPWWVKKNLKLVLSRLPFSYQDWGRFGIFRHGELAENVSGLFRQFRRFLEAYEREQGKKPQSLLELGPGDSVGNALFAAALKMGPYHFVDVGDFATENEDHYKAYADYLTEQGFAVDPPLPDYKRDTVLGAAQGKYLTAGLASLRTLPDSSLDYSFSQAVFEHIRRDEFAETMQELYRLHKKGSFSRHWVDLHDHLGGGANHYRYTADEWERPSIWQSGFYTNRLMMHEMVKMAEEAGFSVTTPEIHRWPARVLADTPLAHEFRHFSDSELNICTFLIELRKS